MAAKKPATMTRVHIVLVMKVAFFFSYSEGTTIFFSFRRMFPFFLSESLIGLVGSD